MSDITHERFTLPRDGASSADRSAAHSDGVAQPPGGVVKSCPAGRGWIPGSRDIGLPEDREWLRPHSQDLGQEEGSPSILRQAQDSGLGQVQGSPSTSSGLTDVEKAATTPPTTAEQHNVFHRERQVRFLEALSVTGNVRSACRSACIAPQTAYRARRACGEFALAWDGALVAARAATAEVLADRALNGMDEPVFYHGEEVARRRRYCSRLLLAHLARLDRMAEDSALDAMASDFDGVLARFAAGEAVRVDNSKGSSGWAEVGDSPDAEAQAAAEEAEGHLLLLQAMEEARYAADPTYDPHGWRAVEERERAQQCAFLEGHPAWWLVGEEPDAPDAQEGAGLEEEEVLEEMAGEDQAGDVPVHSAAEEAAEEEDAVNAPPPAEAEEPPRRRRPTHRPFYPVRQGRLVPDCTPRTGPTISLI